jgi:hypothetical protein
MNEDFFEDYKFMGCNFVYFGENPTFERNVSRPSSGQKCKVNQEINRNRQAELFLLIYAENGGDIFLRNVGIPPNYTVLQPI